MAWASRIQRVELDVQMCKSRILVNCIYIRQESVRDSFHSHVHFEGDLGIEKSQGGFEQAYT